MWVDRRGRLIKYLLSLFSGVGDVQSVPVLKSVGGQTDQGRGSLSFIVKLHKGHSFLRDQSHLSEPFVRLEELREFSLCDIRSQFFQVKRVVSLGRED